MFLGSRSPTNVFTGCSLGSALSCGREPTSSYLAFNYLSTSPWTIYSNILTVPVTVFNPAPLGSQ